MAEMHAVLEALMSHDNEARRKAESYFQEQLATNAAGVVQQLLGIFGGNTSPAPSEVIRSFAGVLLRRAVAVGCCRWFFCALLLLLLLLRLPAVGPSLCFAVGACTHDYDAMMCCC